MHIHNEAEILSVFLNPDNYFRTPQITFSFPGKDAAWPGYGAVSEPTSRYYSVLNEAQINAARNAFAAWDRLIETPLIETADPGQIRVAFTDPTIGGSGFWGFAYDPPSLTNISDPKRGDIWIGNQAVNSKFEPGSYDYMAMMHEIGHALSLPNIKLTQSKIPEEFLDFHYSIILFPNKITHTVVEVTQVGNGIQIKEKTVYPTTPMLYDTIAVQARYGVNTKTALEDNIYKFNQSEFTFKTIYDAGGRDLLDLSGHTRSSSIDLTPGSFSDIDIYPIAQQEADLARKYPFAATALASVYKDIENHFGWEDNLAIAYHTVIEDVKAGEASDLIKGNNADNNITGGSGTDTIEGGNGQDYLRGDNGADFISGGTDFDDINGNRGNDTCHGGEGNDWVVGGQDQDLLYGENGNDIVYGNLGNDTCYGGNGDDWVRGGQGDDLLHGEGGDDFISGDLGNDTIYGGSGQDRFNIVANCGVDLVMDFRASEGDFVTIEAGLAYTTDFVGGDFVINVGNGHRMILVGIGDNFALGSNWLQ